MTKETKMSGISPKILLIYSVSMSTFFGIVLLTGAATPKHENFDEVTVHRINVVEPDGTLRMVISNHAELPGIIVHGQERPFERPQAGMLFYNDEGSENGGLIFGGHRNAKGEVVDSGGSLSFDKFEANQIVQLAGVDDKEDRFAGLAVTDSSSGGETRRRVWVGRDDSGSAAIALMDAKGKKRIIIEVAPDGTPSFSFRDENGKVTNQITPPKLN
jgi:hypothetical protein